jgi:hypothetical protein
LAHAVGVPLQHTGPIRYVLAYLMNFR